MATARRRAPVGVLLVPLLAVGAASASCGADDAPADDDAVTAGDGDHEHDHASDGSTTVTFGADAADTTLTVTLRDYGYVGIPARVAGPNVRFVATIRGANRHELDVISADGDRVAVLPPFAAGDGERTLDAVLPPGTYSVQCRVKEGTRTHAQMGMRQDLVVD